MDAHTVQSAYCIESESVEHPPTNQAAKLECGSCLKNTSVSLSTKKEIGKRRLEFRPSIKSETRVDALRFVANTPLNS